MIEIADSTLKYDRQIKAPLYARFDVPEYWLIDVAQQSITLFQKPVQGKFTIETTLLAPTDLSPLRLPDVKLNLEQLLQ